METQVAVQTDGKCFIYGLREVGTTQVRYVGKARGRYNSRVFRHLKMAREHCGDARVHAWIRDVLARSSMIEAVLLLESTPSNVNEDERKCIAEMRLSSDLLNMQDGGDGGHHMQPMTIQHAERIRQGKLGKAATKEHREAVSHGMQKTIGYPQSCVDCRKPFKNTRAFRVHQRWKHGGKSER